MTLLNEYLTLHPPREAKQVAAQLKSPEHSRNLAKWTRIKVSVMAFILKVKWNQCAKFRQPLISTEGRTICEETSCDYWGVGVAPNLAQYTEPSQFLGENNMGKLQMALRLYVSWDGVLNDKDQMVLPCKPSLYRWLLGFFTGNWGTAILFMTWTNKYEWKWGEHQ